MFVHRDRKRFLVFARLTLICACILLLLFAFFSVPLFAIYAENYYYSYKYRNTYERAKQAHG